MSQELESKIDFLDVDFARNVHEISWDSLFVFENVHGGHGKSGAIDDQANVSSTRDFDVVDSMVVGKLFICLVDAHLSIDHFSLVPEFRLSPQG